QVFKMKDYIKIGILGGDTRMRYAAEALSGIAECAVWGIGGDFASPLVRAADWQGAVRGADAVVLPLPVTHDGVTLSAPDAGEQVPLDAILDRMPTGSLLFGGKLPPLYTECAKERGIRAVDYYEDEAFKIAGAVQTAEGAVAACVNSLPGTVSGMDCAVIGYGRLGRTLANRLRAFGAHVTVAARSPRDRAWAEADGCRATSLDGWAADPGSSDAVFSTVPVTVIGADALSHLPPSAVLFELAAGIDREAAEACGLRVIPLPGLPGKVAPKSAGEGIAVSVARILGERGGLYG
nr:NAD(P)-binding domain-containing protein [Clostridiales bacterium]